MDQQIRPATAADVPAIVALSDVKRTRYAAFQPVFWKKAEGAASKQAAFLQHQLTRENVLALVHEAEEAVDGFVIAALVPSPPVYAAGLTCAIDDFCVTADDWARVGTALLNAVVEAARGRGAAQVVVDCGNLDQPKREMLAALGYSIASEWWTRPI